MKYKTFRFMLPVILILAACAASPSQTAVSLTATVPSATSAPEIATAPPAQPPANNAAEEAEVKDLVQSFGKRLQSVSLLAPDAAQQIKDQYSEFVSTDLLAAWMKNVRTAPGRLVSSPWPDHIEILSVVQEGPGKYSVLGELIEVTSVELANNDAAVRIPLRIVVQKDQEGWLITDYITGPQPQ